MPRVWHFSAFHLISCHAISVQYLVAAQAIYNFAPRLRGIRSSVEFRDALCTCKLGAVKYGERVGPANQLQQTSILDSLDLRPFRISENCFSPTFVVYSRWASGPDNWILTSVAEVYGVWNLATNYHGAYFLSFLQTSSLLQAPIQAGLAPDCVEETLYFYFV